MEHLSSSNKKFYTPYDPYPPHVEDYSQVLNCTEPDQYYSLQTIMELSISGQLGSIRIYDDYDDSEEGAEYEFGTDQFEYRQQLLDDQAAAAKAAAAKVAKAAKVEPPIEDPIDDPIEPTAE